MSQKGTTHGHSQDSYVAKCMRYSNFAQAFADDIFGPIWITCSSILLMNDLVMCCMVWSLLPELGHQQYRHLLYLHTCTGETELFDTKQMIGCLASTAWCQQSVLGI